MVETDADGGRWFHCAACGAALAYAPRFSGLVFEGVAIAPRYQETHPHGFYEEKRPKRPLGEPKHFAIMLRPLYEKSPGVWEEYPPILTKGGTPARVIPGHALPVRIKCAETRDCGCINEVTTN